MINVCCFKPLLGSFVTAIDGTYTREPTSHPPTRLRTGLDPSAKCPTVSPRSQPCPFHLEDLLHTMKAETERSPSSCLFLLEQARSGQVAEALGEGEP